MKGWMRFVLSCLAFGLALTACGTAAPSAPQVPTVDPAALAAVDPASVEGFIVITGSSTVFPITTAAAAAFAEEGSPADIDIRSTGTGGGFSRFCTDEEVDIVNASREVSADEITTCAEIGREPIGFRVGTDALAVVVNQNNTFVSELNPEQLAQVFSGQVQRWSELAPNYPDEQITLYSPGVDSGTFDFFVEEVFDDDGDRIVGAPNVLLSESDAALARGVAGDPNAIGYFGYGVFLENQDALRTVAITDESGMAVAPTGETVADGSYPLARPLYIYSSQNILQTKPNVAAFVSYYLQNADEFVAEAGYFPAPPSDLDAARQALLDTVR